MSTAVISPCATYRYKLTREISSEGQYYPCLFVMLNPSTADASVDDPTIRRCMAFAKREQCTNLTVVNLFAYRATNPADLVQQFQMGTDVFGPENATYLTKEIQGHGIGMHALIIAAWGANKFAQNHMSYYPLSMVLMANNARCLGQNADRSPKHPLYIKADAPLIRWVP